ncbi:transcription factor WhiB, partial [Vibrio vulnificus]
MGQAERSNTSPNGLSGAFEEESALEAQAASLYRSRGVPG